MLKSIIVKMNNIFCAFLSFYNHQFQFCNRLGRSMIILATFTDAFKSSGQSRKCIAYCVPCRTDRSFSFTDFCDGSMVTPNAAKCCNSIDRPGKWIPNGGRHCERRGRTISLVMETACRGTWQQSEKGGYIHKGRKRRETVEKGSREGILNKKKRERERIFLPSTL